MLDASSSRLSRGRRVLGATLLALVTGSCMGRVVVTGRAGGNGQVNHPPPPPVTTDHRQDPPAPPPTDHRPPPPQTDPMLIAGTPVVRVGVNFEDQGLSGDRDYNDAVMCFNGHFKVDGTDVVSIEDQQVTAFTSSHSACGHRVHVEIIHPDGSREVPITFESDSGAQVPMRFQVGSRLEVTMQSDSGGCDQTEVNMHQPANCQVRLDRCNTDGV